MSSCPLAAREPCPTLRCARESRRANETLTAEQCANFLGTLEIDRLRKLAKKLKLTVADHRARAGCDRALCD
jgi:hypothetical protein